MKKRFLTIIFTVILITSCGSYVQVFETKTANTKIENDSYTFENDSIKITYDFWADKGLISFSIYNKLNKPVYVDWKKSSYINNSVKRNYWEDTESTKTVQRNVGNSFKPIRNGLSYYNSVNISSSETTKPEKITFIPPKSNYIRSQFFILPFPFLKVKDYRSVQIPQINNQNKQTTVFEKEFNLNDTPLIFRNFVTFSYSENFQKEFYVDNEFFISKVTKVPENQFGGYKRKPNSNFYQLDENGKKIVLSPFEKGTSFYIRFDK